MLYKVTIGEDVYLGRAEEVVAFLARGEGAPGHDAASYMAGVAARLEAQLGVTGIPTDDATAFLDALDEHDVLPVETHAEPSDERVDPEALLGREDPLVYGPDVDPEDLDV